MSSTSSLLSLGHAFLVGRTGSGKTTAMIDLLVRQATCGRGIVFIDPHGDAAIDLERRLPRFRRNDVITIDPLNSSSPGLNPFARVSEADRPIVVASLLATMKKVFASAWGQRTEQLLRGAFAAVVEVRGATLEDAARMLFDDRHRAWVLRQVKDPATRRFWTEEVPQYSKHLLAEAIAAPLNKLGAVMGDPRVRHVLTKNRPRFDWSHALARNAIVIVRLPKGLLGELNVSVLGSFVLGSVQAALLRRAETEQNGRPPCVVAVDEFWNFAPEPITELLSEGRKYGLSLILACQSISILEPRLRSSLLANAGLVCFRVSGEDAEVLAPEFANEYGPTSLTSLALGEAVARIGPERARVVRFPSP